VLKVKQQAEPERGYHRKAAQGGRTGKKEAGEMQVLGNLMSPATILGDWQQASLLGAKVCCLQQAGIRTCCWRISEAHTCLLWAAQGWHQAALLPTNLHLLYPT
jgi:hypothetical protein